MKLLYKYIRVKQDTTEEIKYNRSFNMITKYKLNGTTELKYIRLHKQIISSDSNLQKVESKSVNTQADPSVK